MEFLEVGFIRAKIAHIYMYSCIVPSNAMLTQHEEMLNMPISDARSQNKKIVVDDLNGWVVDRGSRTINFVR